MTSNEFTEAINNSDPSDGVKLSDIDEEYLSDITGIFKVVGEDIELAIRVDDPLVISKKYDTADFYGDQVDITVHGLDTVSVYKPEAGVMALTAPGDIVYNVETLNGKVFPKMMVSNNSLIGVNSNGNPISLPKTAVKSIEDRA